MVSVVFRKVEHIFCASWRPLESNKNGTMHADCSQEGPSLAVARFSVDDVDGGRKKSCFHLEFV